MCQIAFAFAVPDGTARAALWPGVVVDGDDDDGGGSGKSNLFRKPSVMGLKRARAIRARAGHVRSETCGGG